MGLGVAAGDNDEPAIGLSDARSGISAGDNDEADDGSAIRIKAKRDSKQEGAINVSNSGDNNSRSILDIKHDRGAFSSRGLFHGENKDGSFGRGFGYGDASGFAGDGNIIRSGGNILIREDVDLILLDCILLFSNNQTFFAINIVPLILPSFISFSMCLKLSCTS